MGNHILSGVVIKTRALDKLLPDWNDWEVPLKGISTLDSLKFLTSNLAYPLPHTPQMKNARKNYLISLSKFTRWLGVEIYPGFSGLKLIYNQDKSGIEGVITNNSALHWRGTPKDNFEAWDVLLLAKGCHGSLTKSVINHFHLRKGGDFETYGLGLKEVWRVKDQAHEPGTVVHTVGWALKKDTYGGSWMYHLEDNVSWLHTLSHSDISKTNLKSVRNLHQKMLHNTKFHAFWYYSQLITLIIFLKNQ
ncbi:hypothetical protein BY996DRAFT_4589999 [Phakopsora pachyrhizi]|nr:hypothetical protein BY996DRAFT_4589999 [Phakopsora pachyrhizi]